MSSLFLLIDDFFILINVLLDIHQASTEIKPVLDFHDSRDKTCQWYTCEALRCTCEGEKCKSFTREKNKTKWQLYILKTMIWPLDPIVNCQRPVFSLCVSQHMAAQNNKPVKIWARLVVGAAKQCGSKTPLLHAQHGCTLRYNKCED